MENSLAYQSRKLLEQLTNRRNFNIKDRSWQNNSTNAENSNNLLFNSNNLRQSNLSNMTNKHNLAESFPKSSITSILSRSAYLSKSVDSLSNVSSLTILTDETPKRIPFGISNTFEQINDLSLNRKVLKSADLLGYDWIVGMMENKSKESQLDKPPEYFEDLDKFRRMNKQYCISNDNRSPQSNLILDSNEYKKSPSSFLNPVQYIPQNDPHNIPNDEPRVYAYTLNERLFPVPLDYETSERGIPNSNNPHIIKVSIPSNRFIKNHKPLSNKERKILFNQNTNMKDIGESLSLSSHCHSSTKISIPNSQVDNFVKKINSSRQEPAGLLGNLIHEPPNSIGHSLNENLLPFSNNQPKNEKEAIDQLTRGKTMSKFGRMVPSSLDTRNFKIDSNEVPSNICQTRIALKDIMDDSLPRVMDSIKTKDLKTFVSFNDNYQKESDDVPRPCISRKNMNKVFIDEIENIRNSSKFN